MKRPKQTIQVFCFWKLDLMALKELLSGLFLKMLLQKKL